MKEGEWYFLVLISGLVLITTFFTKNIFVVLGTFAVVMYLKRFSRNIKIPDAYKKYMIKSKVSPSDVKDEKKQTK